MLFCLMAILAWQNRQLVISTFLFAVAINIKMSALLMIPGFLLTVAFNSGILKSLLSLVSMGALQVLFGLEFIMVNKEAYF
jgi:Gpi18-like mannosyltransferase